MKYFILLAFILNSFLSFGQKKVTVYHKEYCSENITPRKCKQEALKAVKEKALLEAGIGESIKSYTFLSSISINDNLTEIFNDEILLNINGFIKKVEFIQEPKKGYDEELDRSYYEVEIKATVKKYKSEADLEFNMIIENLEKSYESNSENLKINIKPFKDCYLKIFYANDFETFMMYPLRVSDERKEIMFKKNPTGFKKTLYRYENQKLIANEVFDKVNYIMPFTEKEIELGKLILIMTKEDIPFSRVTSDSEGYFTQTNIKDVLDWYLKIEPAKKNIIYRQISITK